MLKKRVIIVSLDVMEKIAMDPSYRVRMRAAQSFEERQRVIEDFCRDNGCKFETQYVQG